MEVSAAVWALRLGKEFLTFWQIVNYSLSSSAGVLHRDIGYVPPTDTGSLCLAVDSTHTVVGLFRLLVRRSGTHCSQMNSEIRRVMSTASNSSLKQSCSALTSVTSALEVINVVRCINPRFTYLLTYWRCVVRMLGAVPALRVMKSGGGTGSSTTHPQKAASSCCQLSSEAEAVC